MKRKLAVIATIPLTTFLISGLYLEESGGNPIHSLIASFIVVVMIYLFFWGLITFLIDLADI